MTLVILVFLGGVLTILSPCILPVLPFVFARSEKRFLTNGLPMLVGMAVTFAAIATLAAVGGSWAVRVNQYGRIFALVLLSAFAATLISTRLADLTGETLRRVGQPPDGTWDIGRRAVCVNSLLLGVATGLLWAPCAGPILGLILTGAAISGPNARTTLLLFAYAAGAATLTGRGIAGRRAGFRLVEEISRHRRVGAAGAGRRRAGCGRGHRFALGHERAHAIIAERYQQSRAVAD